MARTRREMAVIIHFFPNMEHARALQLFRPEKQEGDESRAGRKSSGRLENHIESMFSEYPAIRNEAKVSATTSESSDAMREKLQEQNIS